MYIYCRDKYGLCIKQCCGSISQRHESADPDPDPDPPHNVMDPQHWYKRAPMVLYDYITWFDLLVKNWPLLDFCFHRFFIEVQLYFLCFCPKTSQLFFFLQLVKRGTGTVVHHVKRQQSSVVDAGKLFSDPDPNPTFQLVSDPT
jgi:hypothetical protein